MINDIIKQIEAMPLSERVEAINQIKLALHAISPFKNEPVDCVLWVKNELVHANDYNPNSVAPPEMELLETSIMADGYTQPIVTWPNNGHEVVDGFHRHRVGKESETVNARIQGYLPIVEIKPSQQDLGDRMHQAGIKLSQMRICEPFGDEARRGLWLYQVVEPAMWAKVCLRVAGANTGALYSNEKGAVMGNHSIDLPEGHTYQSFALHLLSTMPKSTSEHYKNKLAVYLKWWSKRGYEDRIPDKVDKRLESSGRVPSWRKVVKTFLKNDYWCKGLGFSPTKSSAYQKYVDLMKRRRAEWNIFHDAA